MHVLRHPTEVLAFFDDYPNPYITALIRQRMKELIDEETSMEELVVFVILEAGEGIDHLQTQMAMQIMTNQGSPLWEFIEEHNTCYELVFVLSSSGQGLLVFVPKDGCAPDIFALCQAYSLRSPRSNHLTIPTQSTPQTPPTEAVFLRPFEPDGGNTNAQG